MLALDLAATIRHDGHGGLRDTLASAEGVEAWLDLTAPRVEAVLGFRLPVLPAAEHEEHAAAPAEITSALIDLRVAVRNVFARAIRPAAPTRVELETPLEPSRALRQLNRASDLLGTPQLVWRDDADRPTIVWSSRSADPVPLLIGAVARSAIDFLTGPYVARLRACPAARCVRYFLQTDPRQTWCSPSCGNRERVNRHYRKQSAEPSSLGE